ncbi:MAG: diguanylate cyclase [Leptospirales bacterium]
MKIEHKTAGTMTLLGVVVMILISVSYYIINNKVITKRELNHLGIQSKEIALLMDTRIKEKAAIALTLSTAPAIKKLLQQSNSYFSELRPANRTKTINGLNKRWMKALTVEDPFVKNRMENEVARFLRYQQSILPGTYGEIFLTNRYGVMVATTGKLTTLAHAHKYWWKASYNKGNGKIFFDDRGFDESVKGYVLGIVVPVTFENKIIGILKCNINIMELLTDLIEQYLDNNPGTIRITRTKGLIIAGKGLPLSHSLSDNIIPFLSEKQNDSFLVSTHKQENLMGIAPIQVTLGSEKFAFGGSYESIDHVLGNTGEAWHVVLSHNSQDALSEVREMAQYIFFIGLLITLLMSTAAHFIGRWVAEPIVKLASAAKLLGEGDYEKRVKTGTSDETDSLAISFNQMADNLLNTLSTLHKEIAKRKKAEINFQRLSRTDYLTKILNRRAFSEHIEKNIARAKRSKESLSILMLDVDYFKKVNDTYGHDVGDMVLVKLVRIAMKSIREQDILARWGGEEFVILLPRTSVKEAHKLGERLRVTIGEHKFGKVNKVTVSFGLTCMKPGDNSRSIVKRVDDALYKAKRSGRNQLCTL